MATICCFYMYRLRRAKHRDLIFSVVVIVAILPFRRAMRPVMMLPVSGTIFIISLTIWTIMKMTMVPKA
jgi:uncharacterized membrane protein